MAKERVLFICIGNAIRSQMAEAFARYHAPDRIEAISAGLYPHGSIPSHTTQAMAEKGISLEGHHSKGLYDIALDNLDHIINISGEPLLGPLERRAIKWDVVDPYGRSIADYRKTRDHIESLVLAFLADLN
jgi:protein-tyrosine-phosphatase